MNVYLNSIDGIGDAMRTLYLSKRTWTKELDDHLSLLCDEVLDRHGRVRQDADPSYLAEYNHIMKRVCMYGQRHITMLKFIDLSFMVEGLHRAGQDDWDSHAKRFDNRIIRSSTRLADFGGGEKSDYYKGKIITTDEALACLGLEIPKEIEVGGKKFVKGVNGYILEGYENNKDVKRGLYMLSIPSNFVFRINLTEMAHVYKERNINGTANPEVKELCETIADLIESWQPEFTRELLLAIKN